MPIGLVAAGVGAAGAIGGAVIASNGANSAAKTTANAAASADALQQQEFEQTQAQQQQQYEQTLATQQQVYNDSVARQTAAATDATGVQKTALDNSVKAQTDAYGNSTAVNAPYLTTGKSALDQLAGLYGLSTTDANGNVVQGAGPGGVDPNATFYQTPDYNFTLSQGIKGIDAGAAATGGLDSGATRKAEIAYAGNLAAGQYGNYTAKLQSLAGIGQTASGNQINANSNFASGLTAANSNYANGYSNAVIGAANNSNVAGANYASGVTGADTTLGNQTAANDSNLANNVSNINTNAADTTANAQLASSNATAKALSAIVGQAQQTLGKNPFASSYPSSDYVNPTPNSSGLGQQGYI